MNARLGSRLGALGLGVVLFGCGENDPPHTTSPPAPSSASSRPEAPEPPREPESPAPDVRPDMRLSLAEALGRSRAEIDGVWGEPAAEGRWLRYGDGRLVRYRDGVAVAAQGRERERTEQHSDRAAWLGVPDGVMAGCQRNLEAWCVVRHADVSVEERAGVFRLEPALEHER